MISRTELINARSLDAPVIDQARRDFITLGIDQTVGESLTSLRSRAVGEKIVYFYVIDAEGKLVGVVPTRRLLVNSPETPIERIMVRRIVAVRAGATVRTACEQFLQYRFLALPVVDDDGKLVGVLDINVFTDELSDVVERRAADDAFQLIGVHLAKARELSPLTGFRDRFPWLLCNVVGGILCALLIGHYQAFLDTAIVLALFIPVVLALAESVSIQSTTITLQSMPRGDVRWGLAFRAIQREFAVAILLGGACGSTVGVVAWLWKGAPAVGLAVALSIMLAMMTACILGVVLPAAVRAFRGDPRIAAGPIVLAATDLLTLLVYFSLSMRFLSE